MGVWSCVNAGTAGCALACFGLCGSHLPRRCGLQGPMGSCTHPACMFQPAFLVHAMKMVASCALSCRCAGLTCVFASHVFASYHAFLGAGHEDHARAEADPCRSAHPLQGACMRAACMRAEEGRWAAAWRRLAVCCLFAAWGQHGGSTQLHPGHALGGAGMLGRHACCGTGAAAANRESAAGRRSGRWVRQSAEDYSIQLQAAGHVAPDVACRHRAQQQREAGTYCRLPWAPPDHVALVPMSPAAGLCGGWRLQRPLRPGREVRQGGGHRHPRCVHGLFVVVYWWALWCAVASHGGGHRHPRCVHGMGWLSRRLIASRLAGRWPQ